jgi:nucleoside-diphosphate-sugar epimerase
MIAVVTGSSGFIGSHLVDALLTRGATVRTLVRDDSTVDAADPRVARCRVDLLDDRSVRDAPVWDGATHVFHLAGVTKRRTLAQFRDGNLVPTANLLAAAAARHGSSPPRFILVSSQAAAGPAPSPDRPLREDDPPRPIESYGRSKLEAERAAAAYAERLPVTIVRPAAVYGPRDRDFLRAFRLAASRVQLHAVPREHRFSIVHVADLVDALLLAAERPEAPGRTYFVADDAAPSWRALYAEVGAAAGVTPRVELQLPLAAVAAAGLAGDIASTITGWHTLANRNKTRLARPAWWLCDASRARSELGWSPQIPLQRGVRETYLWYLQAGWLRPPSRRVSAVSSERAPE